MAYLDDLRQRKNETNLMQMAFPCRKIAAAVNKTPLEN